MLMCWTDTVYSLPATRSFTKLTSGQININNNQIWMNNGYYLYLNYSSSGHAYIGNSYGDVYINGPTVNIANTLKVNGKIDVDTGKICFKGSEFSDDTCGISFYYGTQSLERRVLLFDSGGSTILRSTDNNSSDGIKFQNFDGDTRMSILDGGKVGIGTTDPKIIFHVYGYTKGSKLSDYTQDDGHGAHVSNDDGFNGIDQMDN